MDAGSHHGDRKGRVDLDAVSEGIDYDPASGDLRVNIVAPNLCGVFTTIYRYRQGS